MNQIPADPTVLHPFPDQPRVVLLKPLVTSPLIEAGEYSSYDDPDDPAKLIRTRYNDADTARLLALAWWDWPAEHLTEHLRAVMSGTIDDLEKIAPRA
jgi:hypothetical protein